ncbi:MAG: replicative DNA helicase [Actinobacteria bacterium]|nr:replicative DNA helicase [Actinomycetota bacterium]MCL6087479.1 replicative DNA helicase [Actinomycetota bacterium]
MQNISKKTYSRETLNTGKLERIPPYNLEAEESLLGSMLISKDAIVSVIEIVREDDFYRKSNSEIFTAIKELYSKGEPVDPITLADYLKKKDLLEEIGGKTFIHSLISNIPLASNAVYYAEIVKHNSILRKMIYAATDIARMGYEVPDDLNAAVDKAQQLIFSISQDLNYSSRNTAFVQIKEVLTEVYDQTVSLSENKTNITGVTTGFIDLDKLTSGLQNSDLIILAARPGMGKTSLALCISKNACSRDDTPVAIFSLEMSRQQIAQRLLCSESRIDLHRIRSGDIREHEWPKLGHAIEKLSESRIYIDDAPLLTVMDLRARARMLVSNFGVKLIIIDYLQLMQSGQNYKENRVLEITDISRNLKSLARELKIPIIAVSQLSREVEKRPDKRPILADLRESGAIEQDADLVMLIYRDEYYDRESKTAGIAEIIIAKHRNGPIGQIELRFSKEYALFSNLDKTHSEEKNK